MEKFNLILLLLIFSFNSTFAQQFVEQSAVVGIDHSFQARGLMGGGAAFFDFNNDDFEDVYITGGLAKDHLYQNNQDGTFTKINNDIGLNVTQQYNTTAVTTGDIDNDGDRDIFLSTWETFNNGNDVIARNLLFLNNGNGTFSEIGATAGITDQSFSIGAMFMDYNKDGLLDIYVINHVETPAFLYDSTGVIVGFDHDCYPNYLYRNNGDLTFTEVALSIGLVDESCTLASMPTDMDMDGDLDIYLANDFGPFLVPNIYWQNNYPQDQFMDVSAATGTDIPMYGMGIAAGDYDHDQDLDYYITNLGSNVLLENQGGTFSDVAVSAGVENEYANSFEFSTGWGTAFFDIDNDSWLDLYVANGRIPSLPTLPTAFNDPDKLYLNNRDKTFSDITDSEGIMNTNYSRGMANADFDQDGDLDILTIVIDELGGKSKFYLNQSNNNNNYIRFKLKGNVSNADAFGAKFWLYADGQAFLREVYGGGSSFCSQHSSILHFGLGQLSEIDSVKVEWPSGHVDRLGTYAINQVHTIEEGITTSIGNPEFDTEQIIEVYPNPFNQEINIQTQTVFSTPVQMDLFSAEGKIILSRELNLEADTALSITADLPPGIYTLRFSTMNKVFVKKLLRL